MTRTMSPGLMATTLWVALLGSGAAQAADTSLTFNVGAVSDYRYRGISQTRLQPALQGGIDLGLANGLYLGTWASTIKWIDDAGGNADIEIDLYGGWKGEIAKGFTLDVGALTYQYPGNDLDPSANTTEIYGALSYAMFTLKYSHSVTNLFGFADSKGSGYVDLSASFDVGGGWMLAPHIGHQTVRHLSAASYTDYSLAISKDFNGLVPSLAVVDTDTDAYVGPNGKDLGKAGAVLGVKYNF
ncbi:MAG TPA: TorF family putative porin [Ideonella sp.]|uniref:TorF family putative porin n=1 Tax=Ideonella sp. TaxID=1929293 RepID=UPI002E37A142|nr:TorF family putative porin [Ideonella sp.]HEX5687252.1 TorF family putative porin [Ideonella sp.]